MDNKSSQIKQAVAKINLNKIINYQQEHPQSKTLRQIVKCSQKVQESNNEQEIFKLGTDLAYYLNFICDPEKTGCVKNDQEKKYWLELSEELFENTIGKKK